MKSGVTSYFICSGFITASAVRKRLSDLEATLSTPLLYRHTRSVDLTPGGESLLHSARSVLCTLKKKQGELSAVGELESAVFNDDWATRRIQAAARDFSTLPVSARLLVEHLT